MCTEYHVTAQGVDERMINVHYYYYIGFCKARRYHFILDWNFRHGYSLAVYFAYVCLFCSFLWLHGFYVFVLVVLSLSLSSSLSLSLLSLSLSLSSLSLFSLSSSSSNKLMYGETGRYPLFIRTAVKCIKYWNRLIRLPLSRLCRQTYEMFLIQHNQGRINWVSKTQQILNENGFELAVKCVL